MNKWITILAILVTFKTGLTQKYDYKEATLYPKQEQLLLHNGMDIFGGVFPPYEMINMNDVASYRVEAT